MAKTLKQIADEIGVSKQRVYRFVKQLEIPASYQDGNKMYYDETVETAIKEEFLSKDNIIETLHKNSDLEKNASGRIKNISGNTSICIRTN